jgi:CIC family chloride channel protein
MVFEMTDDYGIVIPLMLVAVISYAVARRLAPYGLYDGWLAMRGVHLAHGVDQAVMERLHARAAVDTRVRTVRPGATLDDLVLAAARTRHAVIPVVEPGEAFVGLVTHHALREAIMARGDLARLLVAEDLAEPVEVIGPDDSLRRALAVMNARGLDALPVIDTGNGGPPQFLGLLTRAEILIAYERALAHAV